MPFYIARPPLDDPDGTFGGIGLLSFTTRHAAEAQLTGEAAVEGWTVVEAITAREAIERVSGTKLPADIDVPEPPLHPGDEDNGTADGAPGS